ncbi:oxide-associated 1 [Octopus vulgaris]|uniref:Oxide-associated 1 n=2 Tax=Octopus vulgaris TaxID=6645 RepID=A0AA36BFV8_OCTVU|nr:oxide-associated 1 [Octopus vulgaris]
MSVLMLGRLPLRRFTLNPGNKHENLMKCLCNVKLNTQRQTLKFGYEREITLPCPLTRRSICLEIPKMILCRKYKKYRRRKMQQALKEEGEKADDPFEGFSLATRMILNKENITNEPLMESTEISRPNIEGQLGLSKVFYESDATQKLLKAYEELNFSADQTESFLHKLRLSIKTYEDPQKKKSYSVGEPDPSVEASNVNCPGCGATLHCQDQNRPGYISSKKFISLTLEKMEKTLCFRCLLMTYHKHCLNMKIPIEGYPQILSKIHDSRAIVLFTVDLSDINNSMLHDILPIIGRKRPVYIIGNKVDLIPMDSPHYLKRLEKYLFTACSQAGWNPSGYNIRHIELVSAKTGYGIEHLINKLFDDHGKNGDVYLVGSSNVGKSSIFNILLESDFCKSQAREIFQKATVSVWPGTTLNLLKFPILSPTSERMYKRRARLQEDAEVLQEMKMHQRIKLEKYGLSYNAILRGLVRMTQFVTPPDNDYEGFSVTSYTAKSNASITPSELDAKLKSEKAKRLETFKSTLERSRWLYDTPGVINTQQITSFLNPEELQILLSCKMFRPRTFVLKPNQAMFVTGLGRIDYVEGTENVLLTLINNNKIVVHVMEIEKAEDFYKENIGKDVLQIPLGDEDRLSLIPPLVGKTFHLTGTGFKKTVCDIVLSSIGWVGVSTKSRHTFTLRAYTPGGHGCLTRPALLPNAVNLKLKRIRNQPTYNTSKCLSLVKLPPIKRSRL